MLKVNTRAELEVLKGGKPPAPAPAAAPEPAPQMAQMQAALDAMTAAAATMARASEIIAAGQAREEKKMEAIVHRDSDGRMARVEISVV